MPSKGIKKQVLGGILFCLGTMTALLARILGFELDIFYVAISIIGAVLFLYGAMQEKQYKLARGLHSTDLTARANLASRPSSMRQRVSIHGD